MPRWFNLVVQIVGFLGQALNVVSGVLPPKYMVMVATGIGALQAAVGVIAHNYNPDGTPAAVSYVGK